VTYDRDYALSHSVPADNWLFDALIALLAPQPGWRVLDVGCNTGELTSRLAALQCRTLGLDINANAIALARERFPDLEFRAGTLPELDERGFDAIVASHIIEHLRDAHAFLNAARQRLKPGGRLVLATPNRRAWLRRVAHRLWGVSFFDDPTHVRFYTPPELRELLTQCGFEHIVTSTKRLYFPLAARLPQRVHLAIPCFGLGDHLFASAAAPSTQTNGITGKLNRKSA
jgi:2-polyprenyl-3-methyl-5-hydroxy-6-metoxy-1,4-benzoquinol methylase